MRNLFKTIGQLGILELALLFCPVQIAWFAARSFSTSKNRQR